MGWNKDHGTAAKVNADYAKAQGDVAKQEATNLAQLKTDVEVATQNASTAADNANVAKADADNAASEAITQANHAKNEGDRAKAEADRLAGIDVSVLDNKIGSLSSLNTTNKTSVVESVNEVTTQLAQTAEGFTTKKITVPSQKRQKAMFTIIDDDGHRAALTRLKPLLDSKGIKACAAIVVDYMRNQPDYMNEQEIMGLKNAGWEIMSHSFNHWHLGDQSESTVEYQLGESYKVLNDLGFEVDGMVYPFGSTNPYVLDKTRQIYKYGFGGLYNTNRGYLHTSRINRVVIGDVDTRNLDYFKEYVDRAVKEKSWLVLNTHANTISSGQWENLIGMIDYALTQDIEIVTAKEAFEVFENQVELFNEYTGDFFVVGSSGEAFSSGIYRTHEVVTNNMGININTPISFFEKGKVVVNAFKRVEGSGFPNEQGILETYRHYDDNFALSYQKWMPETMDSVYIRRWSISNNSWLPLEKVSGIIPKRESLSIGGITVPANTNTSKLISPTKMSLGSSKVYSITPTSNPQGIVYTWNINTNGSIVFRFNNLTANPITFIKTELELARELVDLIESKRHENKSEPTQQLSAADELIKYKGLLDAGVLTQEEFDAKKKQLLGI